MNLEKKSFLEQGRNISQNDLIEIFTTQYNDLFSKLLKKTLNEFMTLLKRQIILHLRIIDKQCDSSLLAIFYEKYHNIAKNDKNTIQKIYEEIKSYQEKNYIYLNILDIYIHCNKCKEAIHKCGNKLIIFKNLFFCIKCKRVYNSNYIKLFCKECKKTYITTKRNISEKNNNYLYSVSYLKYHCFTENEEKIKCLKCDSDLYYNINLKSNSKEKNGIRDIFCIKCKLIFDTKEIFFKCRICGEKFKGEPQIYRNFPSIKKYLLLLIHTFRRNVYALPELITSKKCNCDLDGVQYFLHKDNGRLYEGNRDGKKVIICDHCYGTFKSENFNWNCPLCGRSFIDPKNSRNMRFNKNNKKNSSNNTTKKIINKSSEDKNKNEQNKSLNNKNYNYILYNSIAYSSQKNNNFNYNDVSESLDLSLSYQKISKYLLGSGEKSNKVDIYNSDKLIVQIEDNKNNNSTSKKSIKDAEINTVELSTKCKQIKPTKLLNKYENENNINNNNKKNINLSYKLENKRSKSYLNQNYNINKDINNLNHNYQKTEQKNRAISSFRKVIISESKPLFNINESIYEENLLENLSSNEKKFQKFQKNIENIIPQNLFLKNKNNNCNNNNISISINNNVIQLRCSPKINKDNIQKVKIKTKIKKASPEMKLLNTSSKQLLIKENDERNILLKDNDEINKNYYTEKKNNNIKGNSTQKTNNNKIKINSDKTINQNLGNINDLFLSQNINIKEKKIKKIKKVIRDNIKNINKEEINNTKKLIKNESKNEIKKTISKNEIINISKDKDKKDIKNNKNEKKENIINKLSFIEGEEKNEKNEENNQIKKINKINIKKNSHNQINKSKNIKIINSEKNTNTNFFIITNLTKNNISNKELNNINNSFWTENKKEKSNNFLSIITDDNNNNNFSYNIPNSTKNKNIDSKENTIIEKRDENNNCDKCQKENVVHRKNSLSFHINNMNEIKNSNPIKTNINNINNKKKNVQIQVNIKNNNQRLIKNKKKKIIKNINNKKQIIFNDNINIINNNIINNNINGNDCNINNNNINYNNINNNMNINNKINKNINYNINNNIYINGNNNINNIKQYFSSIEKEISLNLPRRYSFDICNSQSRINILTDLNNSNIKTIDSNYYTKLRQIGKGSYGKIYLVEDPKTKEQFALKKIIIGDPLELKENQEEYKLTSKLIQSNPNLKIVKKYGLEIKKLDKYNIVMYILMEAANCDWEQELVNRSKDNAFYSEIELIEILKSLVNTLAILQKKGISHRDIKPQNILCFGKDGYKLSDFGEAKSKRINYNFEDNTKKQTLRGTELYMSPILFKALQMNSFEKVQYNAYKSDVFSLGMCLLLASSLNYQSLYEIREVYDMDILKEIVQKYLKDYSNNYINLIINMLQINEKMRPDFIELNSMII